jgi:tetratricopeptide (TPR) repeat protein
MAQRLSRFADRSIDPPPMTADTIRETELSWEWARSRLDALTEAAAARPSAVTRVLYAGLGLEPVSEPQVHLLCQWFSVALDDWGVQLQRAGQLDAANKRFQQALDLNTNNLAARLNYRCNTNLAAANHPALEDLSSLTSAMTSRKTFRDVFMACGPVDEASFCFYAGGDFRKAGLARQALQQFERAAALAGDRPAPLLALAHTYVECGFEPQARDTILHLRTLGSGAATNAWLDANLSLLEAASWQESTNLAEMQKVLARVLDKYPDEATVDLAEQIYLSAGDFTNALKLAEKKLAAKPDDAHSLLRQAGIFVRMGDFSQSLATLNRVLGLTNSTEVHFLRGAVLAKTDQLDEAAKDFEQAANTAGFQVESQLGLAQIALRQHDTNAAVSRLTLAWKGAPENSAKRQSISRLLNQLMTR